MGVKYVKEFEFPRSFGYTGSANTDVWESGVGGGDDGSYVARQKLRDGGKVRYANGGEAKPKKKPDKKAEGGEEEAGESKPKQAESRKPNAEQKIPYDEYMGTAEAFRQSKRRDAPHAEAQYLLSHAPSLAVGEKEGRSVHQQAENARQEAPDTQGEVDDYMQSTTGHHFARGGAEMMPPHQGALGAAAHAGGEPTISMPLSTAARTAAHLVHVGAQHGAMQAARGIASAAAQKRQALHAGPPGGAPGGAPPGGAPPMMPPRPAGPPPGAGGPPMMGGMAKGGHWKHSAMKRG